MLPRLTRVPAAVHAVTREDVSANTGLACTNEDQIRVGLADFDRAHGRRIDLEVRDRIPVLAAVARLPQATTHGTEVGDVGLANDSGHTN